MRRDWLEQWLHAPHKLLDADGRNEEPYRAQIYAVDIDLQFLALTPEVSAATAASLDAGALRIGGLIREVMRRGD